MHEQTMGQARAGGGRSRQSATPEHRARGQSDRVHRSGLVGRSCQLPPGRPQAAPRRKATIRTRNAKTTTKGLRSRRLHPRSTGRKMVARPSETSADRASLPLAVVGSLAMDLYCIDQHLPGKLPSDSGRFSVRFPYSAHASSSNRAAGPSVEGAESQKRVSRIVWASSPAIVR